LVGIDDPAAQTLVVAEGLLVGPKQGRQALVAEERHEGSPRVTQDHRERRLVQGERISPIHRGPPREQVLKAGHLDRLGVVAVRDPAQQAKERAAEATPDRPKQRDALVQGALASHVLGKGEDGVRHLIDHQGLTRGQTSGVIATVTARVNEFSSPRRWSGRPRC
jgi:hypothetical protein